MGCCYCAGTEGNCYYWYDGVGTAAGWHGADGCSRPDRPVPPKQIRGMDLDQGCIQKSGLRMVGRRNPGLWDVKMPKIFKLVIFLSVMPPVSHFPYLTSPPPFLNEHLDLI